jgi:hypothetical protein
MGEAMALPFRIHWFGLDTRRVGVRIAAALCS